MNRVQVYPAFRDEPNRPRNVRAAAQVDADWCIVASDEELVQRMAGGDRMALADLYDRHAGQMFGLLLKILQLRADAEDVLQDAFWQAWNSASQFNSQRGGARPWLFLIARSRAIDLLRRRRVSKELDATVQPVVGSVPGGALERTESEQQVCAALERIPEEQRAAIRLAFFCGLTHDQVAAAQGIPLGTAKTRIRLGMLRLRELLSEGSLE